MKRNSSSISCGTTIDSLSPEILREVFSFLGPHHYCWVASVHRRFRQAYQRTVPKKELETYKTYYNASSLSHVQFCFPDIRSRCIEQRKLCALAAAAGNLPGLQYLHVGHGCAWDARICARAARHGHWGVLEWLRSLGCPWDASTLGFQWDSSTCSNAANSGKLDVLQ
jgi:F-box domain